MTRLPRTKVGRTPAARGRPSSLSEGGPGGAGPHDDSGGQHWNDQAIRAALPGAASIATA
jgi:hypothetical protein